MPIMTQKPISKTLGVVIPTLGLRESYLVECVAALDLSTVFLVIVGPSNVQQILNKHRLSYDVFLEEDKRDPLALSINKAMTKIPSDIEFVTWIGDDDIMYLDGALAAIQLLRQRDEVIVVYGDCQYMNERGEDIWLNSPGEFASSLISFLPQRISQPASIVRFSAWKTIGGLDPKYKLAFDYDLLIRLRKVGTFVYTEEKLARYRWHADALSVKTRSSSVFEASKVRQTHRNALLKVILAPIEVILIFSTYLFGYWMRIKLRNRNNTKTLEL